MVLLAGNIVTPEQMGKGRELLGPGQFFQHTAQVDHIVRARNRGQWRGVRPDRKSTRLNSRPLVISYAVFFLKKRGELGVLVPPWRDECVIAKSRERCRCA